MQPLHLGVFWSVHLLVAMVATGNEQAVEMTRGDDVLKVRTAVLEAEFSETTGSLMSLRNRATGSTPQQASGDSPLWTLHVDPRTADIWRARSNRTIDNTQTALSAIETERGDDGMVLRFRYDDVGGEQGLSVVCVVEFENGMPELSTGRLNFRLEVNNDHRKLTVTAVEFPHLRGVSSLADEKLLWPRHEGLIISNPALAWRRMSYPLPASMQWMALFNDREGLGFLVLDEGARFKELFFGSHEGTEARRHEGEEGRGMGVVHWAFCASGERWISPRTEVMVYSPGGWYAPADRYRKWLIEEAGWVKPRPPMAKEFTGFGFVMNQPPRVEQLQVPYAQLPEIARSLNGFGFNTLEIKGWHEGGFDHGYPDYQYMEAAGGEQGLREAIRQIHDDGNRLLIYINNHAADIESEWYAAHKGEVELIGPRGEVYEEVYYGRKFLAMCPAAPAWRQRMVEVAAGARALGVDGVFWDQMMEMPAALCFNPSHGHSSPATAFVEGYRMMMEEVHAAFAEIGGADHIFIAEGVADIYAQWIDMCGMMWARRLGSAPGHAWGVSRYTIPAMFLGIRNDQTERRDRDEFAHAFLMGNPFVMGVRRPNRRTFPRYIDIYRSAPEIYFRGRYLHQRGLAVSDAEVHASLIVGEGGRSAAVQLYNPTTRARDLTFTLDLHELGWKGREIASTDDLEGGDVSWAIDAGRLVVSLRVPPRDIRAIRIAAKW